MEDEREIPVVEIPLAGDAAPTEPHGGDRPAPNRRTVAGWSVLAGVVVAIVVAVVVSTGGDEEASTPTTLDPDELASAITVPPTLTPVTDPPVTLPAVPGQPPADAEPPTDVALVAGSVETLPPLTGTVPQPDTFRLSDGSLAALDAPLARRSVTEYVVGVDGFEQTVTITNDPTTGRYLLEFDFGGEVEPVIIDLIGGLTYVRADAEVEEWVTIPNDEVAANTGAPDMATFVRNLQLGPIRSDTRDAWQLVRSNGLVETPGPDDLREWIVVLDAAAVPEWARYAFGPGSEAAPLASNTKIGYAVYVGRDGSIHRVSGSSEFGVTSQRIVHTIEELDDPPVIELPTSEPSTGEPSTGEPSTGEPSTTRPEGTAPTVTAP